jgi:hypothetical protein
MGAADAVAEMEHFGPHAMWRDLRAFVRDYRRAAPRPDRSDRANHPDRRR